MYAHYDDDFQFFPVVVGNRLIFRSHRLDSTCPAGWFLSNGETGRGRLCLPMYRRTIRLDERLHLVVPAIFMFADIMAQFVGYGIVI